MLMSIAIALHTLSAVVWVGGMFFAYVALRPVAAATLEPAQRLPLWARTFQRFFPWVWMAAILLPLTGYWFIFAVYDGIGNAPLYVHIMSGLGIVMIAIFLHVFFAPYQRLRRRVVEENWPAAAKQLAQIRALIATNLTLGLVVVAVAVGGRYL